ncbi:DNA-binding transcriptional regulator, MerR family [Nonomuraea solani]|uniref:DNA-binding transcriptional regulator, MerR family n=1 Tax=Nonomuraea solani TaxID=1144553 RepID=A0A1H6EX57_9ACTN|nr:MerR family transcriptional regulator [Nonomuraea solani]SEH01469.1 DNA-binding transcriptional regulator, MerR family [Nonomuraea solani]
MLVGVDEELLPIGQFARLGRLSVKQLRHYDELGLLRPAYVDAETGYRYYRASQAREALSIALLRSLDVPLPVVGEVLSGAAGALAGVRDGLEAELARRRRTLAALERVMARGLPSAVVRVVREPALRVRVVREWAAGSEDVGRATSVAVGRLLGGEGPVRLVGLFPVDLSEVVEVVVGRVAEDGDEVLPGGSFACVTHVGPYDQISLTVHALLAWCAERRIVPGGSIREVYVSDPAVTSPEDLVTHVMICLEEES